MTGYISIRSRPTREAVAVAEQAYAAIRNGTAKGIGLRDGELVADGLFHRLLDRCRSLRGRMTLAAAIILMISGRATGLARLFRHGRLECRVARTFMKTIWCRSTNCAASSIGSVTIEITSHR